MVQASNIPVARPFSPRKSLGQHFLVDPNTARNIVGALRAPSGSAIIEIGPGTGALTRLLHEQYDTVVALEVDPRAVEYLRAAFPDLHVRQVDVLKADWGALAEEHGQPLRVIGNLPYYITSPILFGLLAQRQHVVEAVLMVQRELADRIIARPQTKEYGVPSVLVQVYAQAELLFRVSRNVFSPKPAVESAVIRLAFAAGPDVSQALLTRVVRTAFNQRRKMLHNSLSAWTRTQGIALPHGWGRRRAEDLSPSAFVELTRYLNEHTDG